MDGVVFTLAAVLRAPPDRRRAWAVGVAVVSLIEAAGLHGVLRSLMAHRLINTKLRSLEAAVSRAWMRGSGAELVQSVPMSAPSATQRGVVESVNRICSRVFLSRELVRTFCARPLFWWSRTIIFCP